MKLINLVLEFFSFYQTFLKLVLKSVLGYPLNYPICKHKPSCSEYAKRAILNYGFWKGSFLALKRILSCI